jgi:hypothetical protein
MEYRDGYYLSLNLRSREKKRKRKKEVERRQIGFRSKYKKNQDPSQMGMGY